MTRSYLICKIFVFAFLLLGLTPKSHAQLIVTENQPFSFGQMAFASMNDPAQVVINPDGSFTHNSNTVILTDPTNGEYTISGGNPGEIYTITVEDSIPLDGSGSATLTLDNITVSPPTGIFDGFGDTTLSVGGRIRSSGGGVTYRNGTYSKTTTITISF